MKNYLALGTISLLSSGCLGMRINREERLAERTTYEVYGVEYREPEGSFEEFEASMLGRYYLVTNDPKGIFTMKPPNTQQTLIITQPKEVEETIRLEEKTDSKLENEVIIIPGE